MWSVYPPHIGLNGNDSRKNCGLATKIFFCNKKKDLHRNTNRRHSQQNKYLSLPDPNIVLIAT